MTYIFNNRNIKKLFNNLINLLLKNYHKLLFKEKKVEINYYLEFNNPERVSIKKFTFTNNQSKLNINDKNIK